MLSIEHLRGRDGIEFGKRAGTIFTLRNAATHCILSMSLLRPGLVEGLLEHGVCVEEAHAGLTAPTLVERVDQAPHLDVGPRTLRATSSAR
jgi:hypothetical protein